MGVGFSIQDVLRDHSDSDINYMSVEKLGNIACLYIGFSDHDGSYTVIGCNKSLSEYIPSISNRGLLQYFNHNLTRNFNSLYKALTEDLIANRLNDNEYHLIYSINSDFANACRDGIKSKKEIIDWCKRHITPTGVAHALDNLPKDEQEDVFYEILADDSDEVEKINAIAINKVFNNASYSKYTNW